MDEAYVACRLIHLTSAMVAFGGGAFRLYAVGPSDERLFAPLDARLRLLLLVAAVLALLSALLLVPLVAGRMAGSEAAALDWNTISAALLDTSFGRVWRWHLLIAALLVSACAIRQVLPAYRVAISVVLLGSLGWAGHVAAEPGPIPLGHEINQSVHLLAAGIWLGGLVPLGWLVARALQPDGDAWLVLLRRTLPEFSFMGYIAVFFVAVTGLSNTVILVGSIGGLVGTLYGRLLLLKILLFAMLVCVAAVNRWILTPRIYCEATPSTGVAALLWTVGVEQTLGLLMLVVASVLGTLPPDFHIGAHPSWHPHH